MISSTRNISLFRFLLLCLITLSTTTLVACGGGSRTLGIDTGVVFFTSAPSSISIPAGPSAAVSYTIGGGTPLYSAKSSNVNIVAVSITGDGTNLVIRGVVAGSTQVTVSDAKGATVTIAVTVEAGPPPVTLFSTAPSSTTIAVGASAVYAIAGGVPAYAVSSSNAAVATVGINGNNFVISGIVAGSAQITVLDSTGASLVIAVTVGSGGVTKALYTTAASAVTVGSGVISVYTIGGGTAPYTATSSNTGVAGVSVSGATLTISAIGAGSAKVLVFDTTGTSVTIDVTVEAVVVTPVDLYTTAASNINVAIGAAPVYFVGGGTGRYNASSSNTGVARVALSGGSLTITGVATGVAKVLVFDTAGASVSIDVAVSTIAATPIDVIPNGATGNVGDVLQFLVSGGTPGYTVTVNNTSIATVVSPPTVAASGGTFSLTLMNVGEAIVTIVDSRGQATTFTLEVEQLSTVLRVSPSALIVGENYAGAFTLNIYGGTGPYRAFTSDETLSSVSISGSLLTVAVGSTGNRCVNTVTNDGTYIPTGTFDVIITAVDSLGASATSTMTIKDNGYGLNTACP
ncbi:MAG: hypothetical protein V4805_12250 [Pseudomonadota bacterium]